MSPLAGGRTRLANAARLSPAASGCGAPGLPSGPRRPPEGGCTANTATPAQSDSPGGDGAPSSNARSPGGDRAPFPRSFPRCPSRLRFLRSFPRCRSPPRSRARSPGAGRASRSRTTFATAA